MEATTANGLCTVRVRALPLPAQLASILDNHSDLLSRSFASEHDELRTSSPTAASRGNANPEHGSSFNGCHDSVAGPHPGGAYRDSTGAIYSNGHSSIAAESQKAEHAHAKDLGIGSLSLENNTAADSEASAGKRNRGSPPESQQAEQQHSSSAPEGSRGAAAHPRKSADIGQLRARLLAAAKEAGTGVEDLFRRAWMLGPHRVSSPGKLHTIRMIHCRDSVSSSWLTLWCHICCRTSLCSRWLTAIGPGLSSTILLQLT